MGTGFCRTSLLEFAKSFVKEYGESYRVTLGREKERMDPDDYFLVVWDRSDPDKRVALATLIGDETPKGYPFYLSLISSDERISRQMFEVVGGMIPDNLKLRKRKGIQDKKKQHQRDLWEVLGTGAGVDISAEKRRITRSKRRRSYRAYVSGGSCDTHLYVWVDGKAMVRAGKAIGKAGKETMDLISRGAEHLPKATAAAAEIVSQFMKKYAEFLGGLFKGGSSSSDEGAAVEYGFKIGLAVGSAVVVVAIIGAVVGRAIYKKRKAKVRKKWNAKDFKERCQFKELIYTGKKFIYRPIDLEEGIFPRDFATPLPGGVLEAGEDYGKVRDVESKEGYPDVPYSERSR